MTNSKKKIVFTNVEIRHYNLTLGNRLVERDLGPALTLDWTFSTSKSTPIDVYETESCSTVSSPRRGERLRLDVEDRISLLVDNFGVCANKLERAMKSGQKRLNRRHVLSPPVDPTKSFSSIDMAYVEKSLKERDVRSMTTRRNSDSNLMVQGRTKILKKHRRMSDTDVLKQTKSNQEQVNRIQVSEKRSKPLNCSEIQRRRFLGRSVVNRNSIRQ
mmetsp:Transcript_20257/g.22689  ORF Transcript_20257/g.22689 Transcript_20257/m.22689 type:complete len:216 (-) Transcript_20257:47-694(-)|eukprot:CAMPEP_0195284218 /NCGR_PEP_ID=MMETSP0707-20130614/2496_1 /TAXON_ID=33640 /ORGANISM="Asterionellopsis glacialis, Strain CCMP134" /LENGTH=215 /DNA_ID=CAMNT_0040343535 /DNA_START=91 /DNA_END=738 /DNA_ORIENTATION=+